MARWAFKLYDKDNSGGIELEEMVDIFCLMYGFKVIPCRTVDSGFFPSVLYRMFSFRPGLHVWSSVLQLPYIVRV
jgi:hypothetical protein